MRTLAIDLGDRRIGLALSDESGKLATPYDVLQVDSPAAAIIPIIKLIAAEQVKRVIVGLPLNMDDSLGPAAQKAIDWGRDLAIRAGIEVLFVDERLSSFQAEQDLIDRKRAGEKLTRARKKRQLDALAAASFLQSFLDGRLPPIEVSR
ncbi:MAG TPA: Holliday junction resolvase RuvX [Tepidisphaeraceae bacterium]|jgi:putative Holliday junction resolvase|nr:Holliday junction resolvase RuvX [Tepidisphaeraceae bacterium]